MNDGSIPASTIFIIAAIIGVIPGAIAQSRGRSFLSWWIFGALFFILALPMSLMLKPDTKGMRQCPHCLGMVPAAASVCQKCGRDLPALAPAGWYPVEGQDYERYWNGVAWTNRGRRD